MADHFERLAEQALGLAPTLRPVVAPIFAPPGAAATDIVAEAGPGPPASRLHAVLRDVVGDAAPMFVERERKRTAQSTPRAGATQEPRAPRETIRIERHEVRTVVGNESPTAMEAAGNQVVESHAPPPVTAREQASARSAVPAAAGVVPRAVPLEPAPPERAVARVAEGGAEEPIVRVTIGRVEVRAVFSQPPERPAPKRPQPDQTLEEYLGGKRRGGG